MKLKIPPPLFGLALLAMMWAVKTLIPVGVFHFPGQRTLAVIFAATGFVISFAAMREFRRAQTTVNPMAPEQASQLVKEGIFQLSRNPMYVGLAFILTGGAIWFGSLLNALVVVFYVFYITEFQIKPEEQAMAKNFGSEYEDYCAKVRRWL